MTDVVREAVEELDAEHYEDEKVHGCVMCWPKDGHWPCTTRLIANDLRRLLPPPTEGDD